MPTSDIYLRDGRVNVIGSGTTVQDGLERGALEVSVAADETPSIRMSAEQANVNVGGGAGTSTEGDIRINDESGTTRIQMTGADDGNRPGDEQVWINGGTGSIKLASSGNDQATLEPSAELRPGHLRLADLGSNTPNVTVDATAGNVDVGGPDGEVGELTLRDLQDDAAVTVSANSDDPLKGPQIRAGNVEFYDYTGLSATGGDDAPTGGVGVFRDGNTTSVEIQGHTGSIKLGYAYTETVGDGQFDPGVFVPHGKSGSIFLDDGNPGRFTGKSRVFEVRALQGTLQVAVDGNRFFEIDPDAGTLKMPDGWTLEDSLPEYNP